MPDNDLAAALEFVKRRSAFVPTADNSTVVSKDELAALRTIRDAYLAREADDAKPVTSDWLVSVLQIVPEEMRTILVWRLTSTVRIRFFDGNCRFDGTVDGSEFWLDNRGDVYAFLRLARWRTNENGGE